MNFQVGDYYKLPSGVSDLTLVPQIAEFDENGECVFERVGKAKISYTVKGEHAEFEIIVEKAKINLILLNGQSNASGEFGFFDEKYAIVPPRGCAYMWDWNNKCLDGDFSHPIPMWEGNFKKGAPPNKKSVKEGFYAPMCDELYNLSLRNKAPEKTVIIHSCRGGASIAHWMRSDGTEGDLIDQAARRVRSALEFFRENSDKYEVVRLGHVWLQGEGGRDENGICSPENYYKDFTKMLSLLEERTGVEYHAIMPVRARTLPERPALLYLTSARVAQYAAAAGMDNVFIASMATEAWKDKDTVFFFDGVNYTHDDLMFTDIHYAQRAYNIMGIEAARTIYARAVGRGGEVEKIRIISADGGTHYRDGDKISLSANIHVDGYTGKEHQNSVYLAPYALPISADSKIEMTVEKDGRALENAISPLGIIRDGAVLPDATLVCKCGGVEARFTLTE